MSPRIYFFPTSTTVSHKAAVKALPRALIIWRLDWGWRTCLHDDGLLTWLLTGGFCSSPRVPLHSSSYRQGE